MFLTGWRFDRARRGLHHRARRQRAYAAGVRVCPRQHEAHVVSGVVVAGHGIGTLQRTVRYFQGPINRVTSRTAAQSRFSFVMHNHGSAVSVLTLRGYGALSAASQTGEGARCPDLSFRR